jgi:VWFA-related protein
MFFLVRNPSSTNSTILTTAAHPGIRNASATPWSQTLVGGTGVANSLEVHSKTEGGRMANRCGVWFILISFSTFNGFSQGPAGNGDRTITLNVVVADKSGKAVSGLQQQDFTVREDKKLQNITAFEAVQGVDPKSGPSVEIILLMDDVNTKILRVAYEQEQVKKFLQRDGGHLSRPVMLAFLSDKGITTDNEPILDGNALVADLDRNPPSLRTVNRRTQGVYGAGDQLQISINALDQLITAEAAKPGRKLVIWISPGWPYLTGPRVQLSSKEQLNLFNEIVKISESLQKADMTIYSVDPLGTSDAVGVQTTYYEDFTKGVKKPSQAQFGDLALQAIAVQSGGRVLSGGNDIAGEIATSAADASNYYVLKFEGAPADGPSDYHTIDVKISKPGLKTITRNGYYAQPGR